MTARTVPEHKAECLNNRHQRGDDADGTAGTGVVELSDEVGVGKIVDARDQHTEDGGKSKSQDQCRDLRFGHHPILARPIAFFPIFRLYHVRGPSF